MKRPDYTTYASNVGVTISNLRKEHNYTQEDFGIRLAEYLNRSKPFSIASISAWEIGRKKPNKDVLVGISGLFGIPVEELLGGNYPDDFIVDGDNSAVFAKYAMPKMSDRVITSTDFNILQAFHNRPVFVVYLDKYRPDQWGIVNYDKKIFVTTQGDMGFWDHPIEVYPMEAYPIAEHGRIKSHPLSFNRMMSLQQVWVEMNTADDTIREMYNGWYVHNKNKDCLVNVANGNVLPDRGYGKSFRVYSEPYDVIERDIT